MTLIECKNCDHPDNDIYEECMNAECEIYIDVKADMELDDWRNSPEYDDFKDAMFQEHLEDIREEKLIKEFIDE